MRKISVVALALVMLLIFVGCVHAVDNENGWSGVYSPNATLSESNNPIIACPTQDLPTMHLEQITSEGLSFFFINPTEMDFIYGERYRLYVREGDYWRLLNNWMAFGEIGYSIEPLSTTQTRNVNFTWFSEDGLPTGEYKFTKDFIYWRAPGDFDEYTAVQGFLIK